MLMQAYLVFSEVELPLEVAEHLLRGHGGRRELVDDLVVGRCLAVVAAPEVLEARNLDRRSVERKKFLSCGALEIENAKLLKEHNHLSLNVNWQQITKILEKALYSHLGVHLSRAPTRQSIELYN